MKTNVERLYEIVRANPIPGGNHKAIVGTAKSALFEYEDAVALLNRAYHTLNHIGAEISGLDTEQDRRIAKDIDTLMKPLAEFLDREYDPILEDDDDKSE